MNKIIQVVNESLDDETLSEMDNNNKVNYYKKNKENLLIEGKVPDLIKVVCNKRDCLKFTVMDLNKIKRINWLCPEHSK